MAEVRLVGAGKVVVNKKNRIRKKLQPDVMKLAGKHFGKPACVLGPALSLAEDFRKRPPNSVLISVNLRPIEHVESCGEEIDYIVFADSATGHPAKAMEKLEGKKVSILNHFTDWFNNSQLFYNGYSSSLAVHFAIILGCNPVLIMGMDCYAGEYAYFNSDEEHENQDESRRPFQIQAWERVRNEVPDSGKIRAVSGDVLIKLFGEWGWNYLR